MHDLFPAWTLLPFAVLVVGIAALPLAFPRLWAKVWGQAGFAFSCAAPVALYCLSAGRHAPLLEAFESYTSFVLTIGVRATSLGNQAALGGTPGFVVNGYFVSGAQPFEAFDKVIKLAPSRAVERARVSLGRGSAEVSSAEPRRPGARSRAGLDGRCTS